MTRSQRDAGDQHVTGRRQEDLPTSTRPTRRSWRSSRSQPRPVSKFPIPPLRSRRWPDGRQEQLNNQARTIMFGLSGEIIQAKTQIVKPTLYDPDRPRLDSEVTDGPTIVAPKVPPVATYDPTSSAGGGLGSARHSAPDSERILETDQVLQTRRAVRAGPQRCRSGFQRTARYEARCTLLSPLGGGAASGIVPTTGMLPLAPGAPISRSISPAVGVTEGVPPSTYPNKGIASGGLIRPGAGSMAPSEMRIMPPGAVIGGPQVPSQSQVGSRTRAPSRVNPIGGVINARNPEGAPDSTGRPTSSQPLGFAPGRQDRRDTDGKAHHWDPDNPWETEQGVPPVLLPAKPQRIDPGPAIGLH